MESNVNYNRFLSKIPWVTDMTGHYIKIDFDFSDFTLEALTHEIVLAKNRSDKDVKNKPTMVFYQSVDSVDINVFLHFVDCFDTANINLGLKYIGWNRLIRNSTRRQNIS